VAYLTAYYALRECARTRRGERILIHSAAGGVGQAALRIAERLGVEILATAGSESKREFLRSQGVRRVMDSRSPAFAQETLDATGGEGVDVVINTHPPATIPKSLGTLRPRGRFVDISNIYSDATLDAAARGSIRIQPVEARCEYRFTSHTPAKMTSIARVSRGPKCSR